MEGVNPKHSPAGWFKPTEDAESGTKKEDDARTTSVDGRFYLKADIGL